ncbi:MAG: Phosphoserine transaminase [Peltula sp. TS41687]|nr:MAG: Phosphoserine transaminase [Peltula sp. TS41687]
MPSRSEVTYFGPGPASIPTAVLEAGSKVLLDYESTGIGLVEHSHRSAYANKILADTKANLAALLEIPDDYDILFMQGGGSGQFSAVVYNLVGAWVERRRRKAEKEISEGNSELGKEEVEKRVLERLRNEVKTDLKLDYLITGSWSLKASQEAARLIGPEHVNVVLDARQSSGGQFLDIPGEETWKLTGEGKGAAFVYYCDNETVDGVEFPAFPRCLDPSDEHKQDEPLVVADMSSNILSRRVDVRKFAVIFAGAQKNVGSTGLTLVIVRKSLLPPSTATPAPSLLRALGLPIPPVILDYATIAKNNSLYNTLSIFDVWIAGQVMDLQLSTYGDKKVSGMEDVARKKADLLYGVLDKYADVYHVVPHKTARSRMNICFRVAGGNADKEKEWLKGAEEKGLMGLKGHRSVGGIRISNYNAITEEGAQKLAGYIESYAQSRKD